MSYIVFIKDKNLKPENIKKGVKILKTMGILEAGGAEVNNQDKTVDSSVLAQYITCDEGYTGLGTVTVNPYSLQSASVKYTQNGSYTINASSGYNGLSTVDISVNVQGNLTPMTFSPDVSTKTYTAPGNYTGYSSVTIEGVTSSIDSNIIAGNIKDGVTILGVTGNYVGEPAEIINQSKSVTPLRTMQVVTKDAGYSGLDDVTVYGVTSSIDSNIQAGNIKSGVNILGVTGNYGGGSAERLSLDLELYNNKAQSILIFDPNKFQFSATSLAAVSKAYFLDNGVSCYGAMSLYYQPNPGGNDYYWPKATTSEYNDWIYYLTLDGDNVGKFIIMNDAQNVSTTIIDSWGGNNVSLDGDTWSNSVDVTNKTTAVYVNGSAGIQLVQSYTYNGNTYSKTYNLVYVDKMSFPEEW